MKIQIDPLCKAKMVMRRLSRGMYPAHSGMYKDLMEGDDSDLVKYHLMEMVIAGQANVPEFAMVGFRVSEWCAAHERVQNQYGQQTTMDLN